jgi:hypothetical protein
MVKISVEFSNPFRPGAGHMPPHLAGRERETDEFRRLLRQQPVMENLVLTGLRGVGKTVLLDTFKPLAMEEGWLWVGTDLSESVNVSEVNLATRLLADLAVVTSNMVVGTEDELGFGGEGKRDVRLSFPTLSAIFTNTPGLTSDKLKAVLELVGAQLAASGRRGLIFAYDEAQTLADTPARDQYPLSLLLDVFQSIQKKNLPFMLVLTGLPTLFPKLVEARTFAERMFRVVTLDRLSRADSRAAILKPIEHAKCPVRFHDDSVEVICDESAGYPYFIQFMCREVYDVFIQQQQAGMQASVPVDAITRKLDSDFFSGRWARATDRQRDLLYVISTLPRVSGEFTVQEVVAQSERYLPKPFSASHVNQMLAALSESGLVYKNRWGKYSLAVPLLDRFILRQYAATEPLPLLAQSQTDIQV